MTTAMDKIDEDSLELFDAPSTFKAAKSLSSQDETSAAKAKNVPSQVHHSLANMQQKENQSNKQDTTKNMEYKIDDLRVGQSLSKVQSLSSMRDTGCTNPMAYTLWHHPTFNEKNQAKRGDNFAEDSNPNTNHDDVTTIHENWDLLYHLPADSAQYASKSTTMQTSLHTSNRRSNNDNDTADDGDWSTSSPVFVPLSMTWTSGTSTTTTQPIDALIEDTATTSIDFRKTTSFGISCPRRHSLPDYISRPIARRPLSTSHSTSSSSSGLQNLIN